jgi:Cu-Zn family superoxide dismutase
MRKMSVLVLLAACNGPRNGPAPRDDAWARIEPLTAGGPSGIARFRTTRNGTRVIVALDGLPPGAHGLHVHAGADCDEPGPHFDPKSGKHGGPMSPKSLRHVGDLGNIVQDWQYETRYVRLDPVVTLDGPESIVGKPIVVTNGQDDLVTDPDGRAGKPVACGVVTAVR